MLCSLHPQWKPETRGVITAIACPFCLAELRAENRKLWDLLEDCAYQGCSSRKRKRAKTIDLCHDFISTWEELIDALVKKGRLRWVKRGVWATMPKGRINVV